MTKINLKNFQEAIKNTKGIITLIAKNLGITRKAVYDYVERHPQAQQKLEEESEKPFDMAESVVFQKLNEKDLKAAEILLLKHKRGRKRGYGEKTELEHSGGIQSNKPSAKELREIYEKFKDGESGESKESEESEESNPEGNLD